ncbi:PID 2 domain containing protein [Scophthalmus maximus]|uniref:PID 2 domain containing protein n=1 Tax=Scophthalmus maximus TaxID=52904 RepID=A0A2U9B0T5_SCOMX|nr:PID 2 domain containing protein [Scophthalmus maximus]
MENRQFWESVGWETMGRRGAGRIRLGVNKVAGASRSSNPSSGRNSARLADGQVDEWERLRLTGAAGRHAAAADVSPKPDLKRAMSLGTFHLMQTLKNSPAAFRRRFRRDRTESLSHGDPLFKVHYLGTEKIFSLDREQAQDAISHLLEGIANGKKLGKDHALVVRPRYVEVKELSTGRQLTKTYLQDIAYCAADANRPNVFLYICKHQGQQLQCRVFWCSRAERARDMTACLAHSFQRALSDWQQDGSATLTPGEMKGKRAEESCSSPANAKSSTLPASLGKVRWKKRGSVSRSPLRAISRRGSASDSWN